MQWSAPGYTEIRQLGRGGSGRVVLAVHDATGIRVAIKYLSEEWRHDAAALARFQSEARLLVTLRDPNIATMWEYIQDAFGACIVMELVNGVSLRALLRENGPAGPEAALAVLKGSLLGLAKAHDLELVHRDYKPENVLVRDDGVSKLVDFGIAVRDGTAARPEGTPPYMAPELWAGRPATPATDVYAATVVFFECLTGQRPYRSTEPSVLGYQHVHAPVPLHEAPSPVRELVRRGLAKDPAERPGSALAFVGELERAARAAYGEDWEERGRRRLSGLVALLALLLPEGPPPPTPETSTSLARTVFQDLRSTVRRVGRSKAATGAGADAPAAAGPDGWTVDGSPVRRAAGPNVRRVAMGGALATAAAVTAVIVLVSSRPAPEQPIGAAAAVPPSGQLSAPPETPSDAGDQPAGSPQAAVPPETGPPGFPESTGADPAGLPRPSGLDDGRGGPVGRAAGERGRRDQQRRDEKA
ncbi:serine/threonine-protein kinase [Nonomuraea aridisoli]|uniref:Serine/threonine protein kinase n=1 Tax=Nonomuraea aridisoli TaxID=2070368 RepID=A0A2W2CRZ8_9ACTN|nr:serine/threonine-protein kinase [Nonomuraea aridisoli]PZG02296.1 serine/threonine protein kinase [Nonomuraea aridisoli]